MNRIEATARLRAHANLPGGSSGLAGIGEVLADWTKTAAALELGAQTAEVVECLEALNQEALDGRDAVPFATPVDRGPAYFVSCILCDLAQSQSRAEAKGDVVAKRAINQSLTAITHVWSQFLAGDVCDLAGDLVLNFPQQLDPG